MTAADARKAGRRDQNLMIPILIFSLNRCQSGPGRRERVPRLPADLEVTP